MEEERVTATPTNCPGVWHCSWPREERCPICKGTAADEAQLTMREFLPMIRAYLDPDQDGPRGWFMRRQMARSNGHG